MARGYNNFQYETSPRKIAPEYLPKKKKSTNNKKLPQTNKKVNNKKETNKAIQKNEKISRTKAVICVAFVFGALLAISYRNSQITEEFSEIKNLKANLATIQKENEQLEVNIESNINLSKIEKEAEEQLGMKKLDSDQKVYISLPKKDYVEPASKNIIKKEENNWFKKIINNLFGK